MSAVAQYRPFKIPPVPEASFITTDPGISEEFAEQDLAKSGLTKQDMLVYTHPQAVRNGASAAYVIPYFGLDGRALTDSEGYLAMFRVRLKYPEFYKGNRYDQPSGEQLFKHSLPPHMPYIHPTTLTMPGDTLICAEGEKKAAAIMKYIGVPTFGIGGCQMWRDPSGSGNLHPWIVDLFKKRNCTNLIIVPDGDVFRYDICNAYGTFARTAEAHGFTVRILNPGDKIDDAIVRWGPAARERWSEIPSIDVNGLVQSPGSLAKQYGLAFKKDAKDRMIVHQHSSNVMRLMEEHPAFPKIWRNLDNNRVIVGDKIAQPDATEMEIANYFQHNMGFDKVTHRLVFSCIQALAKKNARSPMLEYIQSQVWDRVPRLETWMQRLWGVVDEPYYREIGMKWLVSACARMDKPGTKIDWIMIVIGPQKTGKTTMPSILFPGNSITLYGENNDKDFHMLLHSALVVGLDELDSFGRKESSMLKAMISRNEDPFRPPYGASIEVFPRRFTLYGSGNRAEFLQVDPSGYRRYPVVEVSRLLDFKALEEERGQLWAEAWALYKSGRVHFWEVEGASERAERYTIADPLYDQVINWVASQCVSRASTSIVQGNLYFTMSQLLMGIGRDHDMRNMSLIRDVGNMLVKMGIKQGSGRAPVSGMLGRYYVAPVLQFN